MVESKTAFNLLEESEENSSQIPLLLSSQDEHFKLKLGVTEIVGEAGVGKTQIALSTCVSCSSMRMNTSQAFGKSIYVSLGEGTTQQAIARRLDQMVRGRNLEENANQQATSILQRIVTRFVQNQDDFQAFIFHDLPTFLNEKTDVGVLVLDSIASMFRISETSDKSFAINRSGLLFQISAQLKKLSEIHRIPVLVINQVTADFSGRESKPFRPALGLSWENCVNQSYLLTRRERSISTSSGHHSTPSNFLRSISCRISSRFPEVEAGFNICERGVEIA
mmetsp:Transcript_12558/g.19337  ORF Transcript_12558/g.19337 Transcript_12558/m.19337 type:complete len:279 (+) Transcript_12558:151-987(+)